MWLIVSKAKINNIGRMRNLRCGFVSAFLVILLAGGASAALLEKSKVVYALNCGGDRGFMSEHGFEYQPDKYFKNGQIADYPNNHPNLPAEGIKYTRDKQLHQRERYSTTGWLDYELPIAADGDYVLILNFCELNFNNVNQRVTHIFLGETVVRPNHDTVRGGSKAQVSVYIPFNVRNNRVLYMKDIECDNALTSSKALRLRFKAVYDNPKVDGIVLFKGTLEETNFFTLDESRRENDRKSSSSSKAKEQLRDQMMEGYMRKQRMKKVKRNDIDEFEEFEKEYIEVNDSEGSTGRILGIVVLLGLIGIGYFTYQKQSSRLDGGFTDESTEANQASSKSPAKGGKASKTSAQDVDHSKQSPTKKDPPAPTAPSNSKQGQAGANPDESEAAAIDRKKATGKKK